MQRLSRILGLAAVVLLTSLATARAQGPIGICYFTCLSGDHSTSSTYQACCSGSAPVCADGSTPVGLSWRLPGGAEQSCEP
jgi:hypothetical protein